MQRETKEDRRSKEDIEQIYLDFVAQRVTLDVSDYEDVLYRCFSDTLKLMVATPGGIQYKEGLERANDFMLKLQIELTERVLECNENLRTIYKQMQTA